MSFVKTQTVSVPLQPHTSFTSEAYKCILDLAPARQELVPFALFMGPAARHIYQGSADVECINITR